MSPPVEIHTSQQQPEEVYDKSLYHNETVYQDCNEVVEDEEPEGHTIDDDDGPDEINSLKENQSTDKSISIETSTKKSEDETLEENGFGGSVCVNLTKSFIGEERDDDDQEFDNMDDSEIHIDQENESTGDESSVSGKKNDNMIEEDSFDDSFSGNETESYEAEESDDDDPSWNESCSDFSDQSDDAAEVSEKAPESSLSIPLGDLTNINLSTVDTSILGVWLSDTGPV